MLRFIASAFGINRKTCASRPCGAFAGPEGMRHLREMIFTTPASHVGVHPCHNHPRIYGVLMDWHSGDHIATVVSMCDGHASLYTTTTFGIQGGSRHASVRNVAVNFVKAADAYHDDAQITTEFSYPTEGRARIYLLGFDGVRVIDTEAHALERNLDKCSDLWTLGQRVVTELRLATEKKPKKKFWRLPGLSSTRRADAFG